VQRVAAVDEARAHRLVDAVVDDKVLVRPPLIPRVCPRRARRDGRVGVPRCGRRGQVRRLEGDEVDPREGARRRVAQEGERAVADYCGHVVGRRVAPLCDDAVFIVRVAVVDALLAEEEGVGRVPARAAVLPRGHVAGLAKGLRLGLLVVPLAGLPDGVARVAERDEQRVLALEAEVAAPAERVVAEVVRVAPREERRARRAADGRRDVRGRQVDARRDDARRERGHRGRRRRAELDVGVVDEDEEKVGPRGGCEARRGERDDSAAHLVRRCPRDVVMRQRRRRQARGRRRGAAELEVNKHSNLKSSPTVSYNARAISAIQRNTARA
jgi:hypothetical protein